MNVAAARKIIHIDMDAFYASVEQRDNPELRGRPLAVGHDGPRGVVATASYEARKFGVHSAMASVTAKRLCPDLLFVRPRFEVYRSVSAQIHAVFQEYTDEIEPVSLDEAYLDVTHNKKHLPSAWAVARNIRDKIFALTGLSASAGVSYNKFLAKLASDMRKPDGQFLILPADGQGFIGALPIAKFHGIGPATAAKMQALGIQTGADLRSWQLEDLKREFGKLGNWYYRIARAEDDRPVETHRIRKSVSNETTFLEDITDKDQLQDNLRPLIDETWQWIETNKSYGRTVTLKIKWADFTHMTRSRTALEQIKNKEEFRQTAYELLDSIFPLLRPVRLIGIGISSFRASEVRSNRQTSFKLQ